MKREAAGELYMSRAPQGPPWEQLSESTQALWRAEYQTFLLKSKEPMAMKKVLIHPGSESVELKPQTPKHAASEGRRYGYVPDLADHRDKMFIRRVSVAALPDHVDTIGAAVPILDQGQLGSCTGHGASEMLDITLGDGVLRSRLQSYYNARSIEHTISQDAGAQVRDAVKGLFTIGVGTETDWPYDITKFAKKPAAAALKDGAALVTALKAGYTYQKITSLKNLQAALAAGQPVVFGFNVPDYFEDDAFGQNKTNAWFLPFPSPTTNFIGGHCVVAVGYDNRPAKPFIICRNSWGDWGYKPPGSKTTGYFKMDQAYFTDPSKIADDMWIIRKN